MEKTLGFMFDGWSFTIGLGIGMGLAIGSWILLDILFSKRKIKKENKIPVVQYIQDDFAEKDGKQ